MILNMKFAVVLLSIVGLVFSAPQPREKLFHEHFDDFMGVIIEETGSEIDHLLEHYLEFEEFQATINYLKTNNFKDLVQEMESLPEFQAVIDFLEKDNIDIHFFLDKFNEVLELVPTKTARHELSGTNFNAFIADVIDSFPKAKLAALFEEKKAEDEQFKSAVENLYSDEWNAVFNALWENESFQKEVQALGENGINIQLVLTEIRAIFGQN